MGPSATDTEHVIKIFVSPSLIHTPLVPPAGVLSASEAAALMGPYTRDFAPVWADFTVLPRPLGLLPAACIRACDITVSLVMLALTSPILLALAVWIRADSSGPALFRQERLGKNLEPFTFYKFRTMRVDARDRFPGLYAYDYSDDEIRSMRFKIENDPRLTRVGAWLRKTSLDELPNFLNVLKGDMSLVGPRPELPDMLTYYRPWQRLKWRVKPGVSGYAQVQGRGYLTLQETIYWDVRYCLERSFATYVRTLAETLWAVGKGIGAF